MNDYRLVRGSDASRPTSEQLFDLIQEGDTHAIAALDRYCDRLSSSSSTSAGAGRRGVRDWRRHQRPRRSGREADRSRHPPIPTGTGTRSRRPPFARAGTTTTPISSEPCATMSGVPASSTRRNSSCSKVAVSTASHPPHRTVQPKDPTMEAAKAPQFHPLYQPVSTWSRDMPGPGIADDPDTGERRRAFDAPFGEPQLPEVDTDELWSAGSQRAGPCPRLPPADPIGRANSRPGVDPRRRLHVQRHRRAGVRPLRPSHGRPHRHGRASPSTIDCATTPCICRCPHDDCYAVYTWVRQHAVGAGHRPGPARRWRRERRWHPCGLRRAARGRDRPAAVADAAGLPGGARHSSRTGRRAFAPLSRLHRRRCCSRRRACIAVNESRDGQARLVRRPPTTSPRSQPTTRSSRLPTSRTLSSTACAPRAKPSPQTLP